MNDHPFDPRALLSALERHRVNYVVIGGLARVIQGTDEVTRDVDICPSTRPDNLRRLAAALDEIDARGRGRTRIELAGDEPHLDAITELDTSYGPMTLVPEPAGTRGYDDLRRGASREALGGGLRASITDPGDLLRTLDGLDRQQDAARVAALRTVVELERSYGIER